MAFINKITDKVTNATGSLIGRENLTKFSNSINKTINTGVKYREFLKSGNVVQLIPRVMVQPLQIVRSAINPTQLILTPDGQIGHEHMNAHFKIYINPKNQHITFHNFNNYIGLSENRIAGIISIDDQKLLHPKQKNNFCHNIEFRLHEIFGSDEHFALESVHSPGNYLAILPDKTFSTVRNKSDKTAHFQLHVIQEFGRPVIGAAASASAAAAGASTCPVGEHPSAQSKEEESNMPSSDDGTGPVVMNDPPPQYTSLYPQLPPQ